MRARPRCRSIKSVTYDKKRIMIVISKSSFFPEEQKRRILRGYCRDGRLKRIYWALGPVRGYLIIQGQVDASMGVQESEWAKGSSFKVLGNMSEDRFHLGLAG